MRYFNTNLFNEEFVQIENNICSYAQTYYLI